MITRPCPECGRPDAGCGCPPYYVTECRDCGATIVGVTPRNGCHKCQPSVALDESRLSGGS